jgi:TonB family protein
VFMKFTCLKIVIALVMCVTALAQQGYEIIRGPFGAIVAVRDEGHNWISPILVYSDQELELYIPDVTGGGWAFWFGQQFEANGTYPIKLYSRFKTGTPHYEVYFLVVDAHRRTVRELWPPVVLDKYRSYAGMAKRSFVEETPFSILVPRTVKGLTRTNNLIEQEVKDFNSSGTREKFQKNLQQQNEVVKKMVRRSYGYDENGDRNCAPMSDEAWKNWHSTGCPPPTLPPASPTPPALPLPPIKLASGVLAPRAIYAPDPGYSDLARKKGLSGTVLLSFVVDVNGTTRDIVVKRGLGMGLDEKAMEAVSTWRFEPGINDGKPVAVPLNVEISFRLY